jgi:hypothetical protein
VRFERLPDGAEQRTGVRSLQRLQATTSQFLNAYRLIGAAENDNFWVTIGDSGRGRFIVRSRNRPITPIAPPLGCRVDSAHQVSCRPGLIESLVVRLKRGVVTARTADRPIGLEVVSAAGFRVGQRRLREHGPLLAVGAELAGQALGDDAVDRRGGGKLSIPIFASRVTAPPGASLVCRDGPGLVDDRCDALRRRIAEVDDAVGEERPRTALGKRRGQTRDSLAARGGLGGCLRGRAP